MRLNFSHDILEPPFTTEEMETSQTACRCAHKISTMYFEDGKSNFPAKALGMVNDPEQGWIITTWDSYGRNTTAGKRVMDYDLVREGRKEIAASEFIFIGFIGIILILIYLYEVSSHW